MHPNRHPLSMAVLMACVLVGCTQSGGASLGPSDHAEPTPTSTRTPGATSTELPAGSPIATGVPSATPEPSSTSVTPEPSATPEPSVAPTPSKPPEPIVTPGPNTAPPPLDQAVRFYGPAWSGTRFVVAGALSGDGTSGTDEIAWWTSPDGETWSMGGARSTGVVSEHAFGPSGGGVAVGYVGTSAAVWVSSEGVDWRRLPTQEAFMPVEGAETMRLRHVAVGDAGYVAIGESGPWAVILVSADGLTWTRSVARPALTRVTFEDIAGRDGRFAIVGHVRVPYRGAIWTSDDGNAWSELPAPPESDPIRYGTSQVVTGPAGWLMAAWAQGAQRFWWSSDGLSWSPTSIPPEVANYSQPQLVTTSWGFVAYTVDTDCPTDIWLSADTRSWACSELPAPNVYAPEWMFAASDDTLLAASLGSLWVAGLGR